MPVTLKSGINDILVKICNQTLSWDFYIRITDKDGKPFDDLFYASADELLNER